MKNIFLAIAILFSVTAFSQRDRDNEGPTITSVSLADGFTISQSQSIIANIEVYDPSNIFATIVTIDPESSISWRPGGHNRYAFGQYFPGPYYSQYGSYDYIFQEVELLSLGTHTLQIDTYDYSKWKNQTTQTITFTVVE